jgi:hypothetical protein
MALKLTKEQRMEQVMLYGRSDISDQTVSTEFNEQRQEMPPTAHKTAASFAPSCTSLSRTNLSNFIAITRKCKDFKIKL